MVYFGKHGNHMVYRAFLKGGNVAIENSVKISGHEVDNQFYIFKYARGILLVLDSYSRLIYSNVLKIASLGLVTFLTLGT